MDARDFTYNFISRLFGVLSPSVDAFYGPWESINKFETEFRERTNYLPLYIPIGTRIYINSESNEGIYVKTTKGWEKLGNDSNSNVGTDVTVLSAYLVHINNDNIQIPVNSDGYTTNEALIKASTTRLYVTYKSDYVKFENNIPTIDYLSSSNESGSFKVVYNNEYKTDGYNNLYVEYHFEYKGQEEYFKIPENLRILSISIKYLGNTAIVGQNVSTTSDGYSYLISCIPNVLSISKNGEINQLTIDVDKIDFSGIEHHDPFEVNIEISHISANGSEDCKITPIFTGNNVVTIDGNSTITFPSGKTSTLKEHFLENEILFGEYIIIKATDSNNVSTSEVISITRESIINSAITDYGLSLSRTQVTIPNSLRGTNDNLGLFTTIMTDSKYHGNNIDSWISNFSVESIQGTEYTVEFLNENGELISGGDVFSRINPHGFRFTKLNGDCVVLLEISSNKHELDDKTQSDIITLKITVPIMFLGGIEGYSFNVVPNLIGVQKGDPEISEIKFEIKKYENENFRLLNDEDMIKENLSIDISGDLLDFKITNIKKTSINISKSLLGNTLLNCVLKKDNKDYSFDIIRLYSLPDPDLYTLIVTPNSILTKDFLTQTTTKYINVYLLKIDGYGNRELIYPNNNQNIIFRCLYANKKDILGTGAINAKTLYENCGKECTITAKKLEKFIINNQGFSLGLVYSKMIIKYNNSYYFVDNEHLIIDDSNKDSWRMSNGFVEITNRTTFKVDLPVLYKPLGSNSGPYLFFNIPLSDNSNSLSDDIRDDNDLDWEAVLMSYTDLETLEILLDSPKTISFVSDGNPGNPGGTYRYLGEWSDIFKELKTNQNPDPNIDFYSGDTEINGIYPIDVIKHTTSNNTEEYYQCCKTHKSKESEFINNKSKNWILFLKFDLLLTHTLLAKDTEGKVTGGFTGGTAKAENEILIWAGQTEQNANTAPFRVYNDGSIFANDINIVGSLNQSIYDVNNTTDLNKGFYLINNCDEYNPESDTVFPEYSKNKILVCNITDGVGNTITFKNLGSGVYLNLDSDNQYRVYALDMKKASGCINLKKEAFPNEIGTNCIGIAVPFVCIKVQYGTDNDGKKLILADYPKGSIIRTPYTFGNNSKYITFDEIRSLVGKTMTINNNSGNTLYLNSLIKSNENNNNYIFDGYSRQFTFVRELDKEENSETIYYYWKPNEESSWAEIKDNLNLMFL